MAKITNIDLHLTLYLGVMTTYARAPIGIEIVVAAFIVPSHKQTLIVVTPTR